MEINIGDYLSHEEQKEIAKQVFANYISKQLNTEADLKRFLSNTAYDIMSTHCDEFLNEGMQTFIEEKVLEIVKGLSEYTVFHKPNAWDDGCNGMYRFLAECLNEHKPLIKQIVAEQIPKATLETLKGEINYLIVEAVQSIYKGEE